MENKTIQMTFNIEPVAKGRPKFSCVNGYGRAYTPKKTQSFEDIIKNLWLINSNGDRFTTEPLKITLIFEQQFPVSKPKTKDIFNCTKPDLDNYIKSITDALNGIAWNDDSTIVEISAIKKYGLQGRITIIIEDARAYEYLTFNYKKEMEKQNNGNKF